MRPRLDTTLALSLALLTLGLASCRRVSWQLVAQPPPVRSELQEEPEGAGGEHAGQDGACTGIAPEELTSTSAVGLTADRADASIAEGHLVGTPHVVTTNAGATTPGHYEQ